MELSRLVNLALPVAPWETNGLILAAVLLFIVLATMFPRILVFSSLTSYAILVANTGVITIPPVDMRVVGLAQVIYLAMLRGRLPRFSVFREGIFPAVGAYILIGTVLIPWSLSASTAADTLLGTAVTAVVAWFLVSAAEPDEIRSALRLLAGIVVCVSIVWAYLEPGVAIAGGRWRGITTNANTLGIFAGIFFLTGKSSRSRWALGPVMWVLYGSASRASTFGLGLVAGPKLLERQSKWIRRLVATVAIICAIPIVNAVFFSAGDAGGGNRSGSASSVGRTTNSRAEFWEEAVDIIKDHPYTGIGPGSEPELVSSSILSPTVQIGLLAAIPLGLVVVAVVRRFPSPATASRSIFLFLTVNGFFEMWLFAGGSVIFLIYLVSSAEPSSVAALLGRGDPSSDEALDDDLVDVTGDVHGPTLTPQGRRYGIAR